MPDINRVGDMNSSSISFEGEVEGTWHYSRAFIKFANAVAYVEFSGDVISADSGYDRREGRVMTPPEPATRGEEVIVDGWEIEFDALDHGVGAATAAAVASWSRGDGTASPGSWAEKVSELIGDYLVEGGDHPLDVELVKPDFEEED